MKEIRASAPTKVIIAGEHSVVYGGLAVAAPINNRKNCACKVEEARKGKGGVFVEDSVGQGKYLPSGEFEDSDGWFRAKAKVIEFILKSEKRSIDELKIGMNFSKNKIPKGTGHSAATAAVLSLCMYEALGIKISKEKLFEAAQVFEEIAHGGRPSGIDARTVISDSALEFRKKFKADGSASYDFENVSLKLPKGSELLVVNTLKKGETNESTGELLAKFAKNAGITIKPGEMGENERKKLTSKFDEIVEDVKDELNEGGSAAKLGKLFDANHGLLEKFGVSSEGIEQAREICRRHGAYGSKITGAGGRGGAIIAICDAKRTARILGEIKRAGMEGVIAEFSGKGARIE